MKRWTHWVKSLFYTPKHTKTSDDNILRLLLPSIAGEPAVHGLPGRDDMGVVFREYSDRAPDDYSSQLRCDGFD